MVTAVKHGVPRTVMNNSPFYITTNVVPDFGDENENVKRRIAIFNTTTLPVTIKDADKWIYEHAMDCLVWVANQICEHRQHIDTDELWYKPTNGNQDMTVENNAGSKLFDAAGVAEITSQDLLQAKTSEPQPVASRSVVHDSFLIERARRMMPRKRRSGNDHSFTQSTAPSCQSVQDEAERDCEFSTDTESQLSMLDIPLVEAKQPSGPCFKRQRRRAPRAVTFGQPHLSPETTTAASPKQSGMSSNVEAQHSYSPVVPEPSAWVLNDPLYHKKIVELWKANFHNERLCRVDARSFSSRRERAERRIDKTGRDFWTDADPEIDAWMIITGKVRPVFDMEAFVE